MSCFFCECIVKPRFFHTYGFCKDENDKFLWPGFGENMRVIEWILNRCQGHAVGHETQIGWLPYFEDFNTEGLEDFNEEDFHACMKFDRDEWRAELTGQAEFFIDLYDSMPKEFIYQRKLITARLA
ncbi:MAG: phosphoenolpyruvate carboxykinase domain-containing protein [Luteolibacter sp.]